MPTPYSEHVGSRNPVDVLRESHAEYRALMPKFTATQWSMPWQPGKWTAQQIMVHVMQWELIMGVRLRLAVGVPDYTVQPADQDYLMGTEDRVIDGPTAFAAFDAVRKTHILFAEALSPAQRAKKVKHPERGVIDVEDVLITIAGHGVHHLKQFKTY
ncbi:MAG: DinB family protein [Acidobacteria bacterium]|nr:MAG: DinB family protein [Acidobacteriota bacterium]